MLTSLIMGGEVFPSKNDERERSQKSSPLEPGARTKVESVILKAISGGATSEASIVSVTKLSVTLVATTVADLVRRNVIVRINTFLGTEVLSLRDQSVTTFNVKLPTGKKRK